MRVSPGHQDAGHQDDYTPPRKLQHTRRAHPRQSPYLTMKRIPLRPVGKGLGVCSKGVLKQPQNSLKLIYPLVVPNIAGWKTHHFL